ncbi:sensor histidine kinase [Hymenobacter chitinivorans]|uniref:histidine kinase n=1 Tax=Hymenobacter chitinivorans DSM 11115 TaxID=1121954 RepID=A0A2M9B4S8_9BACT|nr:HAMP domain-containing sensor histidine kinase [Hymenobacter chitinivorans]PJJ52948.1 phospho-acceptor domain-containing protein [Hymenobacter chitinivorans DSM 11115]
MKRRIRSIFWLMTLCILGINGFQAYWLYTTYQLTNTQLERTAREALRTVLQQQQLRQARDLLPAGPGKKPVRVILRQFGEGDTADQLELTTTRQTTTTDGALQTVSVQRELRRRPGRGPLPAADTLARNLTRLLLHDWSDKRPVNLAQLSRAYRAELRLRQADAPFTLDTLTIRPRAEARSGVQLVRFAQQAPRAGRAFRTPPLLLNPVRDQYVQASFAAPTSYVLRRMGGLLAGSVLLLGLTTGCFGLMLTTILRQKKLSEVKNDFINNMTHELKTPLATVSAAVEALQHFGALHDPAKTEKYLAISRQELQRLSDLVEKVLHIAVEERQTLELHPEPVQPVELVQELVARHQLRAPKPVHFQVSMPGAVPVCFDRLHVGNVISNLIDNAIKYSREQVTIGIRGEAEGQGWRLTVTDDGIGIPRTYQEAVFDQFFRVPTGNLHAVKGFGLGLYYVRQVVERHGGRIEVRSEPGQGSEFSFWLPA